MTLIKTSPHLRRLNQALAKGHERLKAEVTFGAPDKNCAGCGICRVSIEFSSEVQCEFATAYISRIDIDQLEFSFLKKSICPKVRKRHFSDHVFMIEPNCPIPDLIKSHFNLPQKWLQPGVYEVRESKSFLTIKVACTMFQVD